MLDLILLPRASPGEGEWGGEERLHFFLTSYDICCWWENTQGIAFPCNYSGAQKEKQLSSPPQSATLFRISGNKLSATGQLDSLSCNKHQLFWV
jgi:hypothetical protein